MSLIERLCCFELKIMIYGFATIVGSVDFQLEACLEEFPLPWGLLNLNGRLLKLYELVMLIFVGFLMFAFGSQVAIWPLYFHLIYD